MPAPPIGLPRLSKSSVLLAGEIDTPSFITIEKGRPVAGSRGVAPKVGHAVPSPVATRQLNVYPVPSDAIEKRNGTPQLSTSAWACAKSLRSWSAWVMAARSLVALIRNIIVAPKMLMTSITTIISMSVYPAPKTFIRRIA